MLGVDADIVGTDFRQTLLRSLAELPEGLQAPPRFLERVAVHFARNLLAGRGFLPGQVPLLLGIWGPKVRQGRAEEGGGSASRLSSGALFSCCCCSGTKWHGHT